MKKSFLLLLSSLAFLACYISSNAFSLFELILLIVSIMSVFYYIVKNKFEIELNKKNIIISILFSIFFDILVFNCVVGYSNEKIIITNLSDEPIKISAVYKNNSKINFDKKYKKNLNNDYKIYNKKTENYSLYLDIDEKYDISVNKSKKLEIYIEKGNEDLLVNINDEEILIPHKNLNTTSIQKSLIDENYKICIDTKNKQNNFILVIKIIIMIIFNLIISFYTINFIIKKNNLLILLTLFPFVFIYQSKIFIDNWVLAFILIGSILLLLFNKKLKIFYYKKSDKALIYILSFILAITFFGYYVLNSLFDLEMLFLLIIIIIYINILIRTLFGIIYDIKFENKSKEIKKCGIWHFIFFIVISVLLFAYLYIFSPYIMTKDGAMQLQEITTLEFTDWHPFFSTYFYSLLYHFFLSLDSIIIIRILAYSLLVSSILSYCYKKGINKFLLIILAILSVFPVNGLYIVTFWKDIDFTIALIALVYLLYLLIFDKNYFDITLLHYFSLFISMICVGFFRHNGFIVFIILLLFLVVYSMKKKHKLLIVNCILLIICTVIIKIPLYNYLKIEPAPKNFQYATMLHGLQKEYVLDKVTDETKSWMETILSNKQWIDSYNASNIDSLLHYSGKDVRDMEINKSKLFKYYFMQLKITPLELIKDRLDGTNILWNVFSNDKVDDYKYHIIYDDLNEEHYTQFAIDFSTKKITNIFKELILFISSNRFLDMIFFRGGLSFSILSIFITYNIINKDKRWVLVLLPVLANIVTLFLVMHHQSFRYVWNVNLSANLIILLWITNKISNNK